VKALDDLSQSSYKKEAAEARGLLLQFRSFDEVFFLNVFDCVLGITNAFSLDSGTCQRLLDSVSQTLQYKRTYEAFDVMWMRAKSCAPANGIPICEPALSAQYAFSIYSGIVSCHIGDRTRSKP
jgi:hypothetical protein